MANKKLKSPQSSQGKAREAQSVEKPAATDRDGQRTHANKPLVKRYKMIGSALLLAAFGIQMSQSKAASHDTEQLQAAELDARSHLKSLGYENLYYAEKLATGRENPADLYGAAANRTVGATAVMAVSDQPDETKKAYIRALQAAAAKVTDLDSFNAFMATLRAKQNESASANLTSLTDISNRAERLWWFYIVLYIAGSACVLRSQYLE